jgi:putative ABC transport system permease protein
MMNFASAREGVQIAIDALRSNRVRAALTILGIVIGVATVVAMAAMIGGVRSTVVGQLESFGPKNFIVDRWDPSELSFINDGSQRPPWEGKPAITFQEAATLASMPSIRSVTTAVDTQGEIKAGSKTVTSVPIAGRGYQWPDYTTGEFVHGRNYLPTDEQRSSAVAVLSDGLAKALFDDRDPAGRLIRINGQQFSVAGVYKQNDNIFSGSMSEWAIVPTGAAIKRLGANEEWVSLLVVPTAATTQARAMDDVTSALRTARGIRPAEDNNFALIRQQAFMELFDRITGVFFLVMLVLSSIGLMVGGVGVVAIMMISVTERTREIGVRKALGATRREILWQFLVESMTVTVIGGIIGLLLGGGGAMLVRALTSIPATVPLWSVAAAILVSAVTGIGFGMYPANKAARLDPVEALRHE